MDLILKRIKTLRENHERMQNRTGRTLKECRELRCNAYRETPEEVSKRMKGKKHAKGARHSKKSRKNASEKMKLFWKKKRGRFNLSY